MLSPALREAYPDLPLIVGDGAPLRPLPPFTMRSSLTAI